MFVKRVTSPDPLRSILILYRILIASMYCVLIQMHCNGGQRACDLSASFRTDLACTGSAAAAKSSGGRRRPGGAGCWDGKPGSSRRACSPAGTRQDKCTLHTSSCLVFSDTQTFRTVTRERSRGLTWICCWSRLILCCCWISCCCCLAI